MSPWGCQSLPGDTGGAQAAGDIVCACVCAQAPVLPRTPLLVPSPTQPPPTPQPQHTHHLLTPRYTPLYTPSHPTRTHVHRVSSGGALVPAGVAAPLVVPQFPLCKGDPALAGGMSGSFGVTSAAHGRDWGCRGGGRTDPYSPRRDPRSLQGVRPGWQRLHFQAGAGHGHALPGLHAQRGGAGSHHPAPRHGR